MLRNGRILCDGPREEVMTSKNLSDLFDAPIVLRGNGPYSAAIEDREVALR